MSKSIQGSWSRQAVLALIEVYRKRICLYDFKRPEYHNREMNRDALQEMVDVVSKFHPEVTTMDCKKKYQGLRAQFCREHAKVCRSMKSGAGTEELYTSKLWCYDLLIFLKDTLQFKKGNFLAGPELEDLNEEAEEEYVAEYLEDEDTFSQSLLSPEPGPSGLKKPESVEIITPAIKRKLSTKSTPSPEPCIPKRLKSHSREESPETLFVSSFTSYLKDKKAPAEPNSLFGQFVVNRLNYVKPKYRRELERKIVKLIFDFESRNSSDSE